MIDITSLHDQIAAVAPIEGVSIGRANDKATWRVDFAKDATLSQQKAAQAVIAAFDVSKPIPVKPAIDDLVVRIAALEAAAKAAKIM